MLTVREAARQHVIDEADLEALAKAGVSLAVPDRWKKFASGRPQPDWVAVLHRSRRAR